MYTKKIFPLRLRAALIDFLIVMAFAVIVVGIVVVKKFSPWLVVVAVPVFNFIYMTFTELFMCATVGMKIIRLTVADDKGKKPTIITILHRNICLTLSCIPLGLGFLYSFIDSEKRTIYDYATKTAVVGVKRKFSSSKSKAFIVGIGERFPNEQFSVESGIMLGRDPTSCAVVFNADEPAVSRMHCCLKYNHQTKMVLLEDIGSTYGTFLWNGKKIQKRQAAALSDGDKFYLADKSNAFKVVIKK